MKKLLLALLIALVAIGNASAKTIYVKQGATSSGDGTSWANAYQDLQAALTAAAGGDQVWVAQGIYYPTDAATERTASFTLADGIKVYGGFLGTEAALADRPTPLALTTLSGDIDKNDGDGTDEAKKKTNAYHVVILEGNNTIDGFTITAGYADDSENSAQQSKGAGIYFSDATDKSVTISNNTITGNTANANVSLGGGVYAQGIVTISNNNITGNTANANGYSYGGGVYAEGKATISNNNITGNTANASANASYGGGVYAEGKATISNNTITGNTANADASASLGGGVCAYTFRTGAIRIINNTLVKNEVTGGGTKQGSAVYTNRVDTYIYNSILWGNTGAAQIEKEGSNGTLTVAHCLVEGGHTGGTEILDTNPLFTDYVDNDFTLQATSPAKGAGHPYGADDGYLPTDIEGKLRHTITPCMGAYEHVTPVFATDNKLYVNKHVAPGGKQDGSSWTDAMRELRHALAVTGVEEVWVAQGTYYPTDAATERSASFTLADGVKVYGGFLGTEAALADRPTPLALTTLSGDIDKDDDGTEDKKKTNAYHVVVLKGNNTIDGFTITAGYADDSEANTAQRSSGAGIYFRDLTDKSVTISNNNITGNTSYSYDSYGSGVYAQGIATISNNNITGNTANAVSATSTALGGGVYAQGTATISNNNITGNTTNAVSGASTTYGGGVYAKGTATISNNNITGNTTNASSSSTAYGGGVYAITSGTGTIRITNNTLVKNEVTGGHTKGSAVYTSNIDTYIYNSILWGNTGAAAQIEKEGSTGTLTVAHCLVEGGHADGTEILDTDPLFTDYTRGDFTLQATSPAVGKGDDGLYTAAGGDLATDKDLAGKPRKSGTSIDMGAYESSPKPPTPPAKSSDATLSQLLIEAEGATLSPAFSPTVYDYTMNVLNSVENIAITADANNYKATVEISVTPVAATTKAVGSYPLQVGANKAAITVTAEDGTKKVYTIAITRAGTEVGIQEVGDNTVTVYPTLTTGKVYIQSPKANPTVSIYTLTGKLLHKAQTNEIDLSDYPNAIYIIYTDGKATKVVKR